MSSSDLNDDRQVLEKGRKNSLKIQAASMRDQIPAKLLKKLEKDDFGVRIQKIWIRGNSDRAWWLERQQLYLGDWDEFLVRDAEGPFEGASNLHIPVTYNVCKAYHARMLQAITADDFQIPVKARREDHKSREVMVQDVLRYTLKDWANHHKGVYRVLDAWVWSWVTTGIGLAKWRWDVKYTRFVDVDVVPKAGVPRFEVDENGKEVAVPNIQLVEQEVTKTITCFDGPVLDHISAEDLLWVGSSNLQESDLVIHREWLTASDLWTLVDRKVFDEDVVTSIIDGGPDLVSGAVATGIKQDKAEIEGRSSVDSESDLDRYEILECYAKTDVDGSGINSDIVVWVHSKTGKILRATYLYRVSKNGKRPFAKAEFLPVPGHDYPRGLPEILHPIQVEMDAMHNMRIDNGIIANCPMFFFRSSSSLDAQKIDFEPGVGIPVDDPSRDVFFPQIGNRTAFGMQEEMALQSLVERITGINDITLGAMSGAQGASRTASGVRALVGESNSNLNVHLRRLNEALKELLCVVFSMLQQRIPQGLSFRLTGEDGADYWKQVRNSNDIYGDFDFEVSPNSETSNSAIRTEQATQILNTLLNPLLIQTGIVDQQGLYEGVKNWMQANQIKDFGRYISKPAQMANRLSPQDEFLRVINGMPVPITPDMDHKGYLAYVESVMSSDELLGMISEEQTMAAMAQAKKHEEMQRALDAMAAQQANAMQARVNSQNSIQQTPIGAGPSAMAAPTGQAPVEQGAA